MTFSIDTAKEREWLKRLPLTISEVRHSHACDGGHSVVGGAAATAIARDLTPRFDALLDALDAERAETERLREAIRPFAEAVSYTQSDMADNYSPSWAEFFTFGDFRRAKAALNPEGWA